MNYTLTTATEYIYAMIAFFGFIGLLTSLPYSISVNVAIAIIFEIILLIIAGIIYIFLDRKTSEVNKAPYFPLEGVLIAIYLICSLLLLAFTLFDISSILSSITWMEKLIFSITSELILFYLAAKTWLYLQKIYTPR